VRSVRERVIELNAAGLSVRDIASRLDIAANTVRYHLGRRATPTRRGAPTAERVAALLASGVGHAEIARRLGISKSTVTYHARRLGSTVNERCARRYDWEEVQAYYDEGHSVRECRLRFGFASETWSAAVRRGAVRSRPRKLSLDELLVAGTYRSRHNLRLRLIAEGVKEARCEACGLTSWRGGPPPLALHHVNGDTLDNRLENLELLCMNCHAQTPNFSGRSAPRRKAA
jgi:DNA-binding CsgD family transcriptional regulator